MHNLFLIQACFVSGLCIIFSSSVTAAEYAVDYGVDLAASYDDNVRLNASDSGLSGGTLTPSVAFTRDDQINRFSSNLDAGFNKFDQDGYDATDFHLGANYTRVNEKGFFNLGLNSSLDSSRVTEASDDGSGIIGAKATDVNQDRINASWRRTITERQSITWSASGNNTRYEDDQFSDNKGSATSLNWRYQVNERFSTRVNLSYSELTSDFDRVTINPVLVRDGIILAQLQLGCIDNSYSVMGSSFGSLCVVDVNTINDQRVLGYQIGFDYVIAEKLRFNFLVGQSRVKTDREQVFPDEEDETFFTNTSRVTETYQVNLLYNLERWGHVFSASADNSADSFGLLTLNSRVSYSLRWDVDERSSLSFGLTWSDREAADGSDSDLQNRGTSSATLSYGVQIAEHWRVSGSIERRVQAADFISDGAANRVALTLRWRPTTLKWSR